jgi:hypothetical protein
MDAVAGPRLYPVWLEIDYPAAQSRWKALLRLPLALPVLLVASLFQWAVGASVAAMWLIILARGRNPRWLFDFQIAAHRWLLRVIGYLLLLTDEYAPLGEPASIRYGAECPERLSRWRLVIWKFITSIPHLIVLGILYYTILLVSLIAWVAILTTGHYPKGLHGYVSGWLRWYARVEAYAISLTDEFPPFSLSADAGPGGRESYVICSVLGSLVTAGYATVIVFVLLSSPAEEVVELSYEDLVTGQDIETQVITRDVLVTLPGAADPADFMWQFLSVRPQHRLVEFTVIIENGRKRDIEIEDEDFRLQDTDGDWHDPFLMLTGGRPPPVEVDERQGAPSQILFELPLDVDPDELRIRIAGRRNEYNGVDVVYDFQ